MGLFQSGFMMDSFRSLLSGLGVPGRDKSVSLVPSNFNCLSQNQRDLEALYRSNWLAKKIVEIPAFDATRAWRAWNAQPDEIEKLENTERAFGIQQKVLDAMIKSRLYGGACIVLGVRGSPFNEELDLDKIKEGDLKFVHVVAKWMIEAGPRVRDITSQWFGEPSYYMRSNLPTIAAPGNVQPLETAKLGYEPGNAIWIHPSRVVRMIGCEYPDLETTQDAWGDSVLQACYECLRDAGLVTQSLASMISDCKVDVLRIEGLTQSLSTEEGTNKLLTYLSNANVAKSTVNSLVLDKTIEWDRMQTKFEGLPEVLQAYMFQCAGAADIPATRLFGRSPEGMNATGDSDTRNYYDRLASDQKVRLTPLLNRLDEVIIRTTFGKRDPDIHYTWNPLWQASATEKADIAFKKAQAFQIDNNAGIIPPEALLTARVNQLIEDEVYPGLDAAMDEVDDEFADDHMEYLRRVPPSPEEMMEMAAKKAALKGGPPGGGVPKALTKDPDKTPPKAGPGTKDSSSRLRRSGGGRSYGRYWRNIGGYGDGEPDGHPFRGNQYAEGESGGATPPPSGHRSPHSASPTPKGRSGPIGFVSPSVHNLSFKQAREAVGDQRHRALTHASHDIDERLGIDSSTNRPVLGAWADGAEHSIMFSMPGASVDQARVAAAMKGYLANQKAVLLFEPHPDGDHFMANFKVKGDLDDVHKRLLDNGLSNHTIEQTHGGGIVHIFGMDGETLKAVGKAAAAEGAHAQVTNGTGEFIGTSKEDGTDAEQRADARQQYQKIINQAAARDAPGLRGRDIRVAWNAVRHRWSGRLQDELKALLEALDYFEFDDGEDPGHPFRGNQYAEGQSGGAGNQTSGHRVSAPIAQNLLAKHHDASISADRIKSSVPGGVYKSAVVESKLKAHTPTSAPISKGGFVRSDGSYTPQREALHEQILAKLFNPDSVKAATPLAGKKPVMTLLGGRGGSGKSWFTDSGTVDAKHAIYINPDDIQAQLPGYHGWNAALYHEEASTIAKRADDIARKLGVSVIHDATMRSEGGSAKRISDYQKAGYEVDGHYMFVPPQESAKRALQRFTRGGSEGRYVPVSYLLNSTTNEHTFDDLKDKLDRWTIYQNMGDSPKLVASGGKV